MKCTPRRRSHSTPFDHSSMIIPSSRRFVSLNILNKKQLHSQQNPWTTLYGSFRSFLIRRTIYLVSSLYVSEWLLNKQGISTNSETSEGLLLQAIFYATPLAHPKSWQKPSVELRPRQRAYAETSWSWMKNASTPGHMGDGLLDEG